MKLLHFATCQKSTDTQSIISRHDVVTPGCVRSRTEDTPGTRLAARARPRENGHLYTRTLEREHMMDTDTPMGHVHMHMADIDTPTGHVTYVTSGYLYQPLMKNGISPEPELYKCNTIPILVNIAKIVLTSWISFLSNVVSI